MKKANYFITSEAVKYWKKEVKNTRGRLHVATVGDKIYIVNSYNAFIIPNNSYIFETLVQPAILRPAPDDGRAYVWHFGEFREEDSQGTVNLVEHILNGGGNAVYRTAYTVETKRGDVCRIYKLHNGKLAAINTKYDAMINFSFNHTATMANENAPAVFQSGEFVAVLLPLRYPELENMTRELAAAKSEAAGA